MDKPTLIVLAVVCTIIAINIAWLLYVAWALLTMM
jgi:hypothetical protein